MNRDDRLFAIIGGTVVTAAATVFLVFAGDITGSIEDRPNIRVAPNPVAKMPETASDIVRAELRGTGRRSSAMPWCVRWPAGSPLTRSGPPGWSPTISSGALSRRSRRLPTATAPARELDFAATAGPFLVREDEGRLVIAAGTYRRYNLAVDVFDSLDPADVVAILEELEPAIEAARQDVAWHRGDF